MQQITKSSKEIASLSQTVADRDQTINILTDQGDIGEGGFHIFEGQSTSKGLI
jgi:hypothetical protein